MTPETIAAILHLCREACHPGCSPGAHELAWKILVLAGEREAKEER